MYTVMPYRYADACLVTTVLKTVRVAFYKLRKTPTVDYGLSTLPNAWHFSACLIVTRIYWRNE